MIDGCSVSIIEDTNFFEGLHAIAGLTHLCLHLKFGYSQLDEDSSDFNLNLVEYLISTPSLTSLSLPRTRPLRNNTQLLKFVLQSSQSHIKRLNLSNMSKLLKIDKKLEYARLAYDVEEPLVCHDDSPPACTREEILQSFGNVSHLRLVD
ncbi:hypothetical protein SAMD00019534_044150 [Acytostelium subglobosum LB1]|uniref:hypothetical protein n=1 Tax=Acytostelium subglobosum LB1 TaxID=1410327 RepID=UPI000644AAB7|nr:hypothetical protein SAMD00019534_044150 [Acytostelium subglobosum LB1]GAM21240.1 hypothetical protein SAMD00019534_044150 [Acytostelium subglobosum LB1]|eukprot:XP_012755359.1 hypothetical protein SAMD00019534_044150 [Acytostelium subglobosum LB1]